MNWWRRQFGLHPVDALVHFVAGGFLVVALGEASGNESLALLGTAGLFAAYAWRRERAIAAMPASGLTSGEVKLTELDAQAEELHDLRTRLAELEERVDFSERMLAERQRIPERLGGGA